MMSLAYHCDREPCDTWQRVDSDQPSAWLRIREQDTESNFCSPDCAIRHYATREPMEAR